jgi:hypothetical protein
MKSLSLIATLLAAQACAKMTIHEHTTTIVHNPKKCIHHHTTTIMHEKRAHNDTHIIQYEPFGTAVEAVAVTVVSTVTVSEVSARAMERGL